MAPFLEILVHVPCVDCIILCACLELLPCSHHRNLLEPASGLEPETSSLQGIRSTIELCWRLLGSLFRPSLGLTIPHAPHHCCLRCLTLHSSVADLGLAGFEPAIVVSDIYFQMPKVIGTTKTLVPLSSIAVSTITVNLRLPVPPQSYNPVD